MGVLGYAYPSDNRKCPKSFFFFLFFGPYYDEIAWFSISPYFRALYVVLKVSISQKLYMYHTELAELLK